MRAINIEGQRFGSLVVVELMPSDGKSRRWKCICDCGEETFARGRALRFGSVKSCGCRRKDSWSSRKIDLTGRAFGKLTVIAREGKTKFGKITWLCLCECSGQSVVRGSDLVSGNTKSCGCSQTRSPATNQKRQGLYAICFASGHVKFGRSMNCTKRVMDYIKEGCIAGGATGLIAFTSDIVSGERRLLEMADRSLKHAIGELYAEVSEEEALALLVVAANNNETLRIEVWA